MSFVVHKISIKTLSQYRLYFVKATWGSDKETFLCKYAHGSVECVSWRTPNYRWYEDTSCTCAHLFSMPHLLITDLHITVPQTLYWTSFDFRYTKLLKSHPIGRITVFLNSLCYWVGVGYTFKELLYCSILCSSSAQPSHGIPNTSMW